MSTWRTANSSPTSSLAYRSTSRSATGCMRSGCGSWVNSLEFPTLFPFHTEATLGLLKNVKQSLAIEGNYTGQFTRLLRAETGYKPDHFFGKYDGEPFTWSDVADKVLEAVA